MKKPNITDGEWKWQKFGGEYYLTAQIGMRPMVLATLDGKIAIRKDGLLEELEPTHPDAKAISAVPEMIEALIDIKQQIKDRKATDFVAGISETKVNRALEKAGVEL